MADYNGSHYVASGGDGIRKRQERTKRKIEKPEPCCETLSRRKGRREEE